MEKLKELKFRAWVEKPGTDLRYFRYFGLNTMLPNDISVVAYNQYTGLLDKNGREIYEGDILRFRSYPEQVQTYELVGEVRYSEWGCYCVDEIKALRWEGFHGWVPPPTVNYFVNRPGQEWEVIGNVYENPELLKEDK